MGQKTKYDLIIEAAVKIFAEKGYHETTMKEIADYAGIGKGTIYIHFNNKEGLFSEILDIGIKKMAEYVNREICGLDTPVNKLKKAVKAQLEYFAEHEEFCIFLFREIWGFRQNIKDKINKLHNKHTIIINEIIAEGIEKGDFKINDNETAGAAIVGMIWGATVHAFMFSNSFPLEKIYSEVINIIFEKHISPEKN